MPDGPGEISNFLRVEKRAYERLWTDFHNDEKLKALSVFGLQPEKKFDRITGLT